MPNGFISGIKDEKQDSSWIVWIFIISIIIFFSWLFDEFHKDNTDKFYFKDGSAVFIESKCLLGSIFHNDIIIINDDNIIIISPSFFGTNNTTYPYNKLTEVIFSKALTGYKLVINYPGYYWGTDRTTLYFNQENTFDILYNEFRTRSKNRCVISKMF